MKVALLSRSAHPLHAPGGLERAVFELARHLTERGVETTLITRPPTRDGVFPGRVLTVPYGPEAGHGRILDRTLRYPRFAHRVGEQAAELVRQGAAEVVDAQGLTALGYAQRRRRDRSLKAPLLMNPQGMEEHKARGLKRLALFRLRALSRQAARLADRVVATDQVTRREVPRLLGVDPRKVVVIPNGIAPDTVEQATPPEADLVAARAVPALAGADPVFLSVGRLEAYKGFLDVLGALASLVQTRALPERWAWVVVGQGPAEAELRARLTPDLRNHVHPVGRVSEELLHAFYARSDIFVHATHYEGSSLVTLEAMAHRLPVVATRAGGIPDKVVEGETGVLVEPGDVAALARGLAAMAREPETRRGFGERGRERCLRLFSWPQIIGQVLALYHELLAEAAV